MMLSLQKKASAKSLASRKLRSFAILDTVVSGTMSDRSRSSACILFSAVSSTGFVIKTRRISCPATVNPAATRMASVWSLLPNTSIFFFPKFPTAPFSYKLITRRTSVIIELFIVWLPISAGQSVPSLRALHECSHTTTLWANFVAY